MVSLIFEGCDCTGKSTLINWFINHTDRFFKIFHFQRPPENMPKEQIKSFQKNMFFIHAKYLIHDEDIIFDRYHIGELVYGKLYRKYDIDYIDRLESMIINNCVLICVHCDEEEIKKRFDNRGMPKYDLGKVNDLFKIHCKQSKLKTIFIDTTNKTPAESFAELKLKLQKIYKTDIIINPRGKKYDTGQYKLAASADKSVESVENEH